MTNIQTLPSKSQPTESGRAEMGNFFQPPGTPVAGNLSNPDFDSFLSNPESKTQAEELQEEQEAAKKRKKLVDAALVSPTLQSENPILETQIKECSSCDTSTNQEDVNILSTKSPQDELIEKKEAALEEEAEAEAEIYSESRGMETASVDDEMIALTTVDGTESPIQTLREPAITSINRLAAYAALDRGAIAPLGNSANSSDSGLGNPASGMPTPIQTIRPQAATAASQATTLFKSLAPELDKFKQTGNSQIQLDLPVGDQESVRIKLSLRGGEIRSTFITESPELREALQKAWPEFSQNSRDRGYRLGDPAFQQGFQENSANLGENNRRQSDSRPYETVEAIAPTGLRKGTSNRSTTSQTPSTALWA
jgi:hypothetical protein